MSSNANAFAVLALDDDERGGKNAPESSSGGAGAAAQPATPSSAGAEPGWLPASAPRTRAATASATPKLKDPLIFLDLEMTGLDPTRHTILEISLLATDGSLATTAPGPTLAIHHPPAILDQSMNAWSRSTHARTGLTGRCAESEVSMADAEADAVAFVCGVMGWGEGRPPRGVEEEEDGEASSVREAGGGEEEEEEKGAATAAAPVPPRPRRPRLATLAGNSVHVDRAFLAVYMPLLASCFSHRVVDVSGVSELASRWFPAAFHSRPRPPQESEGGGGAHTAEADVKASLAELRHYRATVFKEDNKEAGRAVAKRYPYGSGGRRRRG